MPSSVQLNHMALPNFGLTEDFSSGTLRNPFNVLNDAKADYNKYAVDDTGQFGLTTVGLHFNVHKGAPNSMFPISDGKNVSSSLGMALVNSKMVQSMGPTPTIGPCSGGGGLPRDGAFEIPPVFSDRNLLHSHNTFNGYFQQQHFDDSMLGKMNMLEYKGYSNGTQGTNSMALPLKQRVSSRFSGSSLRSSDVLPPVSQVSYVPCQEFSAPSSTISWQSQPQLLESQQNHQLSHQPYMQSFSPLETEAKSYHFSGENESKSVPQTTCEQPQLPSEESHANSSNQFRSSIKHKILLAYMEYKRLMVKNLSEPGVMVTTKDCQQSFVNLMHSNACKHLMCRCVNLLSLVSHFDDCQHAYCDICRPVWNLCDARIPQKRFKNEKRYPLKDFSDQGSWEKRSGSSENILPPLKRLKMQSSLCPSSSENDSSCVLTPMTVQPCHPVLTPLRQFPESLASINSEVKEVNVKLLSQTREDSKDSTNNKETENSVSDDSPGLAAETCAAPERVANSCDLDEMDIVSSRKLEERGFRRDTHVADHVKEYSKELGVDFEVRKVEVRANMENKLVAQESDCGKAINIGSSRGLSLTEFFTAELIKEHLSSLRLGTSESTSKKEKGNKMVSPTPENTCQLCGAENLLLAPPQLYCSLCGTRIKHGGIYYSRPEENGIQHSFCTLCYKESRGGFITVNGFNISKAKVEKKKNDVQTEEPWVQCDKCEGWQHQICALFNVKKNEEGKSQYMCPKCCLVEIQSGKRIPLPMTHAFGAKDLPRTLLSDYIEQRLFRRLQEEREENAKVTGKNINEIPEADGLVVRVVLSVDKRIEVKKQLLDIFNDESYPAEFTCRSKVILLFQKIEGVDVCLFALYVQEFGSECGHPNHRCVYISYLDSVKYFRPERETVCGEGLRTFVYHEILIGYLEYSKKRGFASCYLWACPPVKGEDYILYCHPDIQKTPKSDKLRHWYHSMLRKAAKDDIVVDFTNLYDHFFVPSGQYNLKITAARLPYFDGDYWYGAAEKVIKNIVQESSEDSWRKVKKTVTNRALKSMGHANPSVASCKDILLMQKLGQTILPMKEEFIIVHLQFVCTSCHEAILSGWRWFCSQCKNFQLCDRCHDAEQKANGEDTHILYNREKHMLSKIRVDDVPLDTEDKDAIFYNGLFENRHRFLGFCQENNYQFDTLRRAKHSSMMILHYLCTPSPMTSGTNCSICHKDTRMNECWLCGICPNFILCNACYQRDDGHSHKHRLTRYSSAVDHLTRYEEADQPLLLVKKLLDVLLHASQCYATSSYSCSYPNCLGIKRMFHHASMCTDRVLRGCGVCKKVWLALKLHSRTCKDAHCRVPRCRDIKKHVKRTEDQQTEAQENDMVEELVIR